MRAVLQRVTRANVKVDGRTAGEIGAGLVVLVGVGREDAEHDARYLAEKIAVLRVFEDKEGRMNRSVVEAGGGLLIISQFTLYGDVRRGRRPSWFDSARPEQAEPLYELFVSESRRFVSQVETGSFRRMMQVELVNDGPVTILLDSKKLF